MGRIILVVILVLWAQTASADVMLVFRDKTAHVWQTYYEKTEQYCTLKEFGEFCVNKKDVQSIKNVPPGTKTTEYGVSTLGAESAQSDEYLNALQSLNCTQLRISTSERAQRQYRDECMTPEEQEAWDKQKASAEIEQRMAREQESREAAEAARKKQAAEESKRVENSRQRRSRP